MQATEVAVGIWHESQVKPNKKRQLGKAEVTRTLCEVPIAT